jgi:hypothetical protein
MTRCSRDGRDEGQRRGPATRASDERSERVT